MRDTLPFLYRLGLDQDADARSIRRAYARELKLIDPEQDSAGFQALREAYDTALQWLDWRAQQAPTSEPAAAALDVGVPCTPVTVGKAPTAPPDAQSLSHAVFDEFHAAMAQLLSEHRIQHNAEWQRILQRSLDDERLIDLGARLYFEAQVAQLLASGWRPGHETLFAAASEVFRWQREGRRLQQLGHAGAVIDQALRENSIYQQLPESERMIQHAALALLRTDGEPTAYQLRADMPYVERLAQLFPTWMPLVVDMERVAAWRAGYAALPPKKKSWWPKLSIDLSARLTWAPVLILFMVFRFAMQDREEHTYSRGFPQPAPQVVPEYRPLPEYLRQNIADRMLIIPPDLGPGEHAAEFFVTLNDAGRLDQISMYRSSGSISYDEAVSKALRASQPLPPETPRKFQVTFTVPTGSTP